VALIFRDSRATLAALSCSLLACQEVVPLPPPPTEHLSSALWVWLKGGEVSKVDALAVGDAALPLRSFSVNAQKVADLAVVQVGFRCPLEDLGVAAGSVYVREQPSADLDLPAPVRLDQLAIGADSWSRVEDPTQIFEALRRIPLTSPPLCERYGAGLSTAGLEGVPLDGVLDLGLADLLTEALVPLGDGSALASLVEKKSPLRTHQLRIDRGGRAARVDLPFRVNGQRAPFPSGRLVAGSDRSLWLVTTTGSVAHGTLESGLDVVGRMAWFGTQGSTIAGRLTNAWTVGSGPTERLLAGFTHDDGQGILEHPEAAVLAFVPSGPPELVDTLTGFGQPSVAEAEDGSLVIAGLDLERGHLRQATRSPGGGWSVREVPQPTSPFRSGLAAPVWVGRVGSNLRVSFVSVSVTVLFGTRSLRVGHSAIAEGPLADLVWIGESATSGLLFSDVVELPEGLLLQTGLDEAQDSWLLSIQRGLRGCGRVKFKQPTDPQYALDRTRYFDEYRTFLAVLDEDTVLVMPSHTITPASLFRRPVRALRCLLPQP